MNCCDGRTSVDLAAGDLYKRTVDKRFEKVEDDIYKLDGRVTELEAGLSGPAEETNTYMRTVSTGLGNVSVSLSASASLGVTGFTPESTGTFARIENNTAVIFEPGIYMVVVNFAYFKTVAGETSFRYGIQNTYNAYQTHSYTARTNEIIHNQLTFFMRVNDGETKPVEAYLHTLSGATTLNQSNSSMVILKV